MGLLKTDQGDEYSLLYNFKLDGDLLTSNIVAIVLFNKKVIFIEIMGVRFVT